MIERDRVDEAVEDARRHGGLLRPEPIYAALYERGLFDAALRLMRGGEEYWEAQRRRPGDPPMDANPVDNARPTRLPPGYIEALADADRLDEALALYRDLPEDHRPPTRASVALAAAARRAGREEVVREFRDPLAKAVADAPGAASRLDPAMTLFMFDLTTGDPEAALKDLAAVPVPHKAGVVMMLHPAIDGLARGGRISQLRDVLSVMVLLYEEAEGDERRFFQMTRAFNTAAGAHVEQGEEKSWLAWSRGLPTAEARVLAEAAIARVLVTDATTTDTDP